MLTTLDDIRIFWKTNQTPLYFISPTLFNLIGLDQWVGGLRYITFIDTFSGKHPHALLPTEECPISAFKNMEEINEYLLSQDSVVSRIDPDGYALFLFFNDALEKKCQTLRLTLCLPRQSIVRSCDSKINTTLIGNQAGVHSVPNVLARIDSYETLTSLAKTHHLGSEWVIQTAYGDSGKTTFFISDQQSFEECKESIITEDKVKVMKKIRCVSAALEACATSQGTFVGPLMRELIGVPTLTPYQGGWCGNDLNPDGFTPPTRCQAQQMAEKLGNVLYQRGYRGYFEIDFLIDLDTNTVYLGELNPRISGVTAMTNLSPFCQKTIPLFLFHLLEFYGVPFNINPKEYNAMSLSQGAEGCTGQLILKYTPSDLKKIYQAPHSGVYTLTKNHTLAFKKGSSNRHDASGPHDVFLMRIMDVDEYVYQGADLCILFVNIPLLGRGNKLTQIAKTLIQAAQSTYQFRSLTNEEQQLVDRYHAPSEVLK